MTNLTRWSAGILPAYPDGPNQYATAAVTPASNSGPSTCPEIPLPPKCAGGVETGSF